MFEIESAALKFVLKEDILALAKQPLSRDFYARNTVEVAQELLGKVLLVRENSSVSWDDPEARVVAGRIVETEAYRADDPASHSARGETPRNSVMFGRPGKAYVYFIYGMYEMLNFVTEPHGQPGAVLIRALEPVFGTKLMAQRRGLWKHGRFRGQLEDLTSGPGKLCRAFGIQRTHNGQDLMGPSLIVAAGNEKSAPILKSGRIGIRQGTDVLWRFFLKDNLFVSRSPQNAKAVGL